MIDRDNIIRMAREAGMEFRENADEFNTACCDGVHCDELARFAELVRKDYSTTHANLWLDRIHKFMLEEREACAKIADEAGPYTAADLIRARGGQ